MCVERNSSAIKLSGQAALLGLVCTAVAVVIKAVPVGHMVASAHFSMKE